MIFDRFFSKGNAMPAHRPQPALTIPDNIRDDLFTAQPAHIQTILTVMNRIACDLRAVTDRIRRGLPLVDAGMGPIYCRNIPALFERINAQGAKSYLTFSYTQDLATIDPNAQVHLSQFFERIAVLNAALTTPQLRAPAQSQRLQTLLDQTLVQALFFKGVFSAHDLTTKLLLGRLDGAAAGAAFQALQERSKADYLDATPCLFNADSAFAALPMTTQQLLVEVAKPYEEGQRVIHGVYFDAEMGAQMAAYAARRKAG